MDELTAPKHADTRASRQAEARVGADLQGGIDCLVQQMKKLLADGSFVRWCHVRHLQSKRDSVKTGDRVDNERD